MLKSLHEYRPQGASRFEYKKEPRAGQLRSTATATRALAMKHRLCNRHNKRAKQPGLKAG
jgi:hypothetical protein